MMKHRWQTYEPCFAGCRIEYPWEWYQNNWEPNFTCQHEARLPGMGDGGKWICDWWRIDNLDPCLVYSVGSYNQFDFEEAILERFPDCEIHTFDPSVGEHPSNLPDKVHFHNWGFANEDGPIKVGGQVWNMYTSAWILKKLGHKHRQISIFKIDCEGCEFDTVKQWPTKQIRQIQVEMHGLDARTTGAPRENKASAFFEHLQSENFVIFHKEPNTLGCQGSCIEYAFLRLDPSFFEMPASKTGDS